MKRLAWALIKIVLRILDLVEHSEKGAVRDLALLLALLGIICLVAAL